MNSNEEKWVLLARYLAGEASPEDERRVEKWLEADPAQASLFKDVKRIWDISGIPGERIEIGDRWTAVQNRMTETSGASERAPLRTARRPPRRRDKAGPLFVRPFLLTAAMVLIIAGSAYLIHRFSISPGGAEVASDSPFREVIAKDGQLARIQLIDGTEVTLNAGSTLRIPPSFDEVSRAVFLEGEAFFDVTHRPERPFSIHTGEVVARVLGTTLNVTAYPDDPEAKVLVQTGSVAMRSERASPQDTVVLRPGQLGVLVEDEPVRVLHNIDMNRHLAWMDGRLVFDSTPFAEVERRLERRFDIDIHVQDSLKATLPPLNASFNEESVGEVLRTVSAALGVCLSRENQDVFLHAGSGCST